LNSKNKKERKKNLQEKKQEKNFSFWILTIEKTKKRKKEIFCPF